MIVNRTISPEEEVEVDGEMLTVPALVHWLIVCPDHQVYVPVTVQERDLIEIPHETARQFVDAMAHSAKMELEQRDCFHEIPELEIPVSSD